MLLVELAIRDPIPELGETGGEPSGSRVVALGEITIGDLIEIEPNSISHAGGTSVRRRA
jgi:hypothetical protein